MVAVRQDGIGGPQVSETWFLPFFQIKELFTYLVLIWDLMPLLLKKFCLYCSHSSLVCRMFTWSTHIMCFWMYVYIYLSVGQYPLPNRLWIFRWFCFLVHGGHFVFLFLGSLFSFIFIRVSPNSIFHSLLVVHRLGTVSYCDISCVECWTTFWRNQNQKKMHSNISQKSLNCLWLCSGLMLNSAYLG